MPHIDLIWPAFYLVLFAFDVWLLIAVLRTLVELYQEKENTTSVWFALLALSMNFILVCQQVYGLSTW